MNVGAWLAARTAHTLLLCAALAVAVVPAPALAQAWDEIVARARGQTVNWNAGAGDENTNAFIGWVGA
jgi:putative thiamine transport system substrate-binding protein